MMVGMIELSDDQAIGTRLLAARQAANLSQAEVALRLRATFQQIQKYEKGANRVSATRLIAFARLYEIDAGSLLGDAPSVSDEAARLTRRPGAMPLLRAFSKISSRHLRCAAIDLVESLGPRWIWTEAD